MGWYGEGVHHMKPNPICDADTAAMKHRPGPLVRTWKRQFRAALRGLALPKGPLWFRWVFWWVATPTGLFANFFCWFAGCYWWGPQFFVSWLAFSLFTPSAIVYYRNTKAEAEKEMNNARHRS